MRRVLTVLGVGVTLALLAIVPASASTLVMSSNTAVYQAAAGETNDLTVSEGGGLMGFSDPGATITPMAPCVSVNAHTATCPASQVLGISAALDDMNDQGRFDDSIVLTVFSFAAIDGGAGQDNLTAGGNTFSLLGGGDGQDVLNGSGFFDSLAGGPNNDVLNGGSGQDQLDGGDGDDILNGNSGDDGLAGGEVPNGADVISGGPGRDFMSYDRNNGVNVSLDGAANDGGGCPGPGCENDNVGADVEEVEAGDGNDVLTGSSADNILRGFGGNDQISGGGGEDSLSGDDGNDTLDGGPGGDQLQAGAGADTMSGGGGDDTLTDDEEDEAPDVYSGGPGSDTADFGFADLKVKVTLDGRPGDGIVSPIFAPSADNVRPDVENVFGGLGADILIGSKSANQLEGGNGNDQLLGGGGADGLLGENGNDSLIGGKGRDLLDGAAGKDRIASRDRKPDEVDCGSSLDRVKADRVDRTSPDCEKVRRS